MKILLVISYYYPAWSYGGPGKLVYEIAAALTGMRHRVTVLTTDAFSGQRRRRKSDGPPSGNPRLIIHSNLFNYIAYRFKFFLPLFNLNQLNRLVKDSDVIHFHEFFTFYAILVSYLAIKNSIPYFISAHGTLDGFHLMHRQTVKKIFIQLFGHRIISRAAGFIAATDEEIKEYRSLGIPGQKIRLVRNGIDTSHYAKLPVRGSFRRHIGLDEKTLLALYLGRINKLKGLSTLVSAVSRVRLQTPFIVVIAGSDDGYLSYLRQKVKELGLEKRIIFHGILAGRKKLAAFSDSDIFVYPSPAEGFSLGILEAGAARLPLLITEGCKFPEVAGRSAGIITDASVTGLADGLEKLMNEASFLEQAGKNARKLIMTGYSVKKMTENLISVYREVL